MVVLDDRGPEAIAEEMSFSAVALVEALGVDAVQAGTVPQRVSGSLRRRSPTPTAAAAAANARSPPAKYQPLVHSDPGQ
jgi:hypothetical protein